MTPDTVEDTWRTIEAEGRTERGWHVRKVSDGPVHELQAGRRMPSGSVGLLYELDASAVPSGTEWPDGKGFRTKVETLVPGSTGRIRVALELTVPQYREVFGALCGDISEVVMATKTSRAGFSTFLRRLHAWQKFMQIHADRGLSNEKIRGLFAELHVIEAMLMPMLGEAEAISVWQGPHALHDFDRNGHALEVKSGAATGDPVFHVSRLDQLDETTVRSLHLAFVPLTEVTGRGSNLPEIVARLRARVKSYPGAEQRLEDLLVGSGYHESQASLLAEPRLVARDMLLHRVEGNFPRLRRDSVAAGIVSGRYAVRVASCSDWLAVTDDLARTFGEDLHGAA
ncbi:PD-(D/E)XK motif protein [Sphingomonas sp. OK281]|uniref:PD-(D/E)XK motif protein n=1 Tax=Sphingomonas sp. OK281 TaxID=1881067 RepID=UPI0008EB6DF2|nr:PD-(D/E)XK motif protein [Sphingomonas sp. OK281]SFO30263.1 Putative PD-(D/E)XK family member [Sphingomonas sp. OK281]